ncbi:MAG: hypothetical protein ACK5P5_08120 [Pseudobdellovibrionaceae bacterium]
MRNLIIASVFLIGANGFASTVAFNTVSEIQTQMTAAQIAEGRALDWKVNDTNNYKMNVGGFLSGTMVMKVTSKTEEGIWVNQDIDLSGNKQVADTLFDANSGAVIKTIVNGKEQAPAENDQEIESVTQEKITVAAGTFDCLHAVLVSKKDQSKTDAWVNPQIIPISGAIKLIAPSQFGKVTMELTSFKKN